MGHGHKFDVKKVAKLHDPERLKYLNPEAVWTAIGDERVRTIVDIGAGIGFFAIPYSRKITPGKVYACDISEEMLGHLAESLQKEKVENVEPVHCEEVRVPLAAGIADLVMMFNLHHELDHPTASLAETVRLLAPGGKLAILDWKAEQTPTGPPLHVRVPPDQVASQMTEAGLTAIAHHPVLEYHYLVTGEKP